MSSVTTAELRGYISDMLSELAELARRSGDRLLEASLRLLAVEAAVNSGQGPEASDPPD